MNTIVLNTINDVADPPINFKYISTLSKASIDEIKETFRF